MSKQKAISALAYAIWDSVHTVRLESPEDYEAYELRAKKLLYAMKVRTRDQKAAIAKAIRKAR